MMFEFGKILAQKLPLDASWLDVGANLGTM